MLNLDIAYLTCAVNFSVFEKILYPSLGLYHWSCTECPIPERSYISRKQNKINALNILFG